MAPTETHSEPWDAVYRPESQAEREDEKQLRESVAATNARSDLVWLLSGKRGRRIVRQQLREAGVSIGQTVSSSFQPNYGLMCFQGPQRDRALRLLADITALLASGELPQESVQLLMSETDA